MNTDKATAEGSTEAVKVPDSVCLVASRFFFAYDAKYGEFRKRIHGANPRYGELKGIVDDPGYVPAGDREHHGRILEACDVYDTSFQPKGHSIVTVCGGYNGGGSDHKWCEYLGEISGAIQRLTDRFGFSWLVRLHDHSDVWYAEIGFTDKRGVPADGADHAPCFGDDAAAYAAYRERALAANRPFGLVDWGRRSYDWAWEKLGGTHPFPHTAFHGSLIAPTNVANHYAAYDAERECFRDTWGVYSAPDGAFVAVTAKEGGFPVLMKLSGPELRACADARGLPCLEDWANEPGVADAPRRCACGHCRCGKGA